MNLPGRIIDLSSPLDNHTVYDPPFMRPKIEYRSNAELPAHGFTVACFPFKIKSASGGWTRVVALFD